MYPLPGQALVCRLAGVPPEGHSWSPAATAALRELVAEGEVVALRVLAESVAGCPEVELHLLDDSHGSINLDLSTEFDIFPPCPAALETITSSPLSSLGALPPLGPALAPAAGALVSLQVAHAVSPDSFVVRLVGEGQDLAAAMAEHYGAEGAACRGLVGGEPFYAVPSGGRWQRVEVAQVVGTEDGGQAVVGLVDAGGQAVVGVEELRHLPEHLRLLPCQALVAALAGVTPAAGHWTPEDNAWFNQR